MEGDGPGAAGDGGGSGPAGSSPDAPAEDVHGRITGALSSASPILDLSQSGLRHLGEIFTIPTLRQLHLQRNALRGLPADFFQLLPGLTWLDLRHNRVTALPPGIGAHRCLRALLLERNPIRTLPVELGGVATLTALNLRHCPLEFPPPPVVQQGLGAVRAFLRFCAAQRGPPGEPAPPALPALTALTRGKQSQPPPPPPGRPRESRPAGSAHSPGPGDAAGRPSAEPPEEWPSPGEIRRFWALRQEIVGLEQAKILTKQLLAVELPPNLREVLHPHEAARPGLPRGLRRKTRSLRGALPGPAASQPTVPEAGRLEESRAAALRELRERQAQLERRRRDSRVLQEWREHTQALRARQERLGRGPRPRRTPPPPVASRAPFATALADDEKTPATPPGRRRPSREQALPARKERSAFRVGELEEKVKQHDRRRHERSERRRGVAPLEGVRKAAGGREMAGKLQDEVTKRKSAPALAGSPRLPALAAGSLPARPAAGPSRGVVFNTKH